MTNIFLVTLVLAFSSISSAGTVTVSSGTVQSTDFAVSDDVVINGSVSFKAGTYNINSLTINSGKTLTALSDVGSGTGVVINATGTVTVTGTFSADSQGYGSGGSTYTGPGAPTSNGWGASYGGLGGGAHVDENYIPRIYGNALEPVSLGSSGINGMTGYPGGGAIKIKSAQLTLTGKISAVGEQAYGSPGGSSGGSIFLDVDTITGTGTLDVSGGAANAASGGGGGRIGILSNTLFSGTVTIAGGVGPSSNGGAGSFIFRYKSSTNDLYCNVNSGTAALSGFVFTSDLPTSLNNLNLSNGCMLNFYGDLFTSGNISVSGGSTLGIKGNTVTGITSILAANNISVDSTSKISATGLGYGSAGPGSTCCYAGGSHGGVGGNGYTGGYVYTAKVAYGNAYQPTQLGSGAYYTTRGGGAIKVLVLGQLQIEGSLSADGLSDLTNQIGGGSGGSLLIYTGSLVGAGKISANGAKGGYYSASSVGGGGGGGRIAFLVAGTNTFSGTMTATGGASGGGSATAGADGTVVNFTPTAATKIAVSTQPSQYARKNEAFSAQPIFSVVDTNGYIVPTYSTAITIAVYTNATCTTLAGGTLQGTFQNITGFGVGRGIDLNYDTLGTVYIKASSGSLTSACTSKVMVGSLGTRLVITTQPSSTATAGSGLNTNPILAVRDDSGNTDYTYSNGIIVTAYSDATCTTAIPIGSPPSGGTLETMNTAVSGGVVTWDWLNYTLATTVYLKFSGSGLASACSNAIVFSSDGTVESLVYTTQPSTTAVTGQLFAIQPVLGARDWLGNTVTTASGSVTFASYTNSSCTTSTAGLSVNATTMSGGVASVSGMSFATAKTIYIKATFSGVSVCSQSVVVSAPAAVKLLFVRQPSAQVIGRVAFPVQPQIAAADSSNTTVTTYVTAIALAPYTDAACTTPATGTLAPTSVTPVSGVATTSGLRYNGYGRIYIRASSGALTTACSAAVQANAPNFFRGF